MSWRVAESLQTLLKQLNDAFPKRSKASDGSIGDANHASRNSDHNPWIKDKKGQGVVTARDFTHDPKTGINCQWLADTLVRNKDPRIKYLIWNKQICSSTSSPWKWRPYSGINAHTHHLHLSVLPDAKLYDSKAAWTLDFPKEKKSNDVAKVSAATPPYPKNASEDEMLIDQQSSAKQGQPSNAPLFQNAEAIVNTGSSSAPAGFVPETIATNAPAPENVVAKTTAVTIGGIAIPAFLVAIFKAIQSAIENGFIDARELGNTILNFIVTNQKYSLILLGLLVGVIGLNKLYKQVTLWLSMWINTDPNRHNIVVVPATNTKNDAPVGIVEQTQ